MALKRKDLSAMGLEPAQIDAIIEGHSETVNALQDEIGKLKDKLDGADKDSKKLKEVQKELDDLKEQVEADAKERKGKDYDALKKEFEDYKAEQVKKAEELEKKEQFQKLLKDLNVSEKGVEMILKWQGVSGVELGEDGKISNAKELRKAVKEDWADYIEKEGKEGANSENPPKDGEGGDNPYSGMTREEIMKISDTTKRQEAIASNLNLFGR